MKRYSNCKDTVSTCLHAKVWLQDPQTGEWLQIRRIVLRLDQPTRSGDEELILNTNLPETVHADHLCEVYRQRWQFETHNQRVLVLRPLLQDAAGTAKQFLKRTPGFRWHTLQLPFDVTLHASHA